LSTTEEETSTITNATTKKAKQALQQEELDLVDLNPEEQEEQQSKDKVTDSGALVQPEEEEFDPNEYGGFPMEAWNKYLGAINDKRQARTASLAKLTAYTVRMDMSKPDAVYPDFKYVKLSYSPITKSAWERRRRELAEIEDMEREQQMSATRLAEMQESLRLRIFARGKPRGMITNREDPSKAQLEEIQNNMKFYQDISTDISRRVAEKKQISDLNAFQIYFHKTKDDYDRVMNEDVDDILRACDWKQTYGSANLRLSKPSSSQVVSQGIS
jgi:hypothetical protein